MKPNQLTNYAVLFCILALISTMLLGLMMGCKKDKDEAETKHCTNEAYPLWCPNVKVCCTPGHPYYCDNLCYETSCPSSTISRDICRPE